MSDGRKTQTSGALAVRFTHHEETDIHELTFLESSRRSAEQGLEYVTQVFEAATNESRLRLLLDMRQSGLLPFNSVITAGREWNRRVKVHPTTRMVILVRQDAAISLLQPIFSFMRFGHLKLRIFQGDRHTEAVAWLLKEG
jgi:hypothetical protein